MAVQLLTGADLGAQRAVNAADPTAATDLTTKQYVDALVNGIAWKTVVRAATSAAGTLATSFANGQTVDGVVLATGNRILVKNQAAGAENGLYTVNASGAPTRSLDADAGSELVNATCMVSEGTVNADTAWTCTNNATITLGVTALVFAQVPTTNLTAGNGISIAGGVVSAVATTGVTVTAPGIGADFSVVGRKFTQTIGDGVATSIVVTHNLGNQYPAWAVFNVSTSDAVIPDVDATTANTMTFIFATAPAASAYRVMLVG